MPIGAFLESFPPRVISRSADMLKSLFSFTVAVKLMLPLSDENGTWKYVTQPPPKSGSLEAVPDNTLTDSSSTSSQ